MKVFAEFEVPDGLELEDIALALELRFDAEGNTAVVWKSVDDLITDKSEEAAGGPVDYDWHDWEATEDSYWPFPDDPIVHVECREGAEYVERASDLVWDNSPGEGTIGRYRRVPRW